MADRFCLTFHLAGTQGADRNIRFQVPEAATLIHLSAVSTTAGGGLSIGTAADGTAILAKTAIGDAATQVPTEKGFTGFATYASSRAYPRLVPGTVYVLALDYDYVQPAGSTNAANVTLVLTFLCD